MTGWLKHPCLAAGRLVWFVAEVTLAALSYAWYVWLRPPAPKLEARALWLQRSSRRILRVFQVRVQASGAVPARGLLVSNHLSYLDILVLSSLTPSVFVAKSEVRRWPVFGWFAAQAGTLFIRRDRRTDVGRLTAEMQTVLDGAVLLVVFPEGTSSGGDTVLPFRSSLLEPATDPRLALAASLISYALTDGDPADEVCYWRDMTFLPHLLNLLTKQSVQASVIFKAVTARSTERKTLAGQLHVEVLSLKAAEAATLRP